MSFALGLLIGVPVGVFIGVAVMALFRAAKRGEDRICLLDEPMTLDEKRFAARMSMQADNRDVMAQIGPELQQPKGED